MNEATWQGRADNREAQSQQREVPQALNQLNPFMHETCTGCSAKEVAVSAIGRWGTAFFSSAAVGGSAPMRSQLTPAARMQASSIWVRSVPESARRLPSARPSS